MKTIYYNSLQDDVVGNSGQHYKLPDDYQWIREGFGARIRYAIMYAIVKVVAFVYLRLILGVHFVGREKIAAIPKKQGIFLYGNHTLEIGDPFLPVIAARGRRCWGIASSANFGIPIIGKLQPWIGALPIGNGLQASKSLSDAVSRRVTDGGCVIIYPEAHVWPYYTAIRPFEAVSFHYPVECNAPVFSMTTTYTTRTLSRRPRITVYIDGPFEPDWSLSKKQQKQQLRDQVWAQMNACAANSNYKFIDYVCKQNKSCIL